MPTKAELNRQIAEAQRKIQRLESLLQDSEQTRAVRRRQQLGAILALSAVGVILLTQVVFVALGKESPFAGTFVWLVIGLAGILAAVFLAEIGIMMGRDVTVKANRDKEKKELELLIKQKEAVDKTPPTPSSDATNPS